MTVRETFNHIFADKEIGPGDDARRSILPREFFLHKSEGVMRRSRNEVARWRMIRQVQRRRARWLEGQSRRYGRMHAFRHQISQQQRRSILFITQIP